MIRAKQNKQNKNTHPIGDIGDRPGILRLIKVVHPSTVVEHVQKVVPLPVEAGLILANQLPHLRVLQPELLKDLEGLVGVEDAVAEGLGNVRAVIGGRVRLQRFDHPTGRIEVGNLPQLLRGQLEQL